MFDQSGKLNKQLEKANKRLRKAMKALAPKHKGGEMEEYRAAQNDVLRLERELAEFKGEEYAVPSDFPVKWDIGAPLPFLLCNDYKTYLTFYISDPDPNWDGTYVRVVDPSSSDPASLCLVTFRRCLSVKFGHPNDEVHLGHPLYGRGLESYTAQIVMNSKWIKEVAKNNSVHQYDEPEHWKEFKHYIFWFHDNTFECLAESYEVEVTSETMGELLNRIQGKLLE